MSHENLNKNELFSRDTQDNEDRIREYIVNKNNKFG